MAWWSRISEEEGRKNKNERKQRRGTTEKQRAFLGRLMEPATEPGLGTRGSAGGIRASTGAGAGMTNTRDTDAENIAVGHCSTCFFVAVMVNVARSILDLSVWSKSCRRNLNRLPARKEEVVNE